MASAETIAESPATLGVMLQRRAAKTPNKRAFVFLERGEREYASLTYAELEDRAATLARHLVERRLKGERVVLAYPTCPEFVIAVFACFLAGAIAVPAPLAHRGKKFARTLAIVADARAAAILSLDALVKELRKSDMVSSAMPPTIATDLIGNEDPRALPTVDAASIALLQYTSGSTGNPRGVMLTHANLVHNQMVLARVLRGQPDEMGVVWLPLYHDMGLIGGVLYPVWWGGSCVLMSPLDFLQRPLCWLNAISTYGAAISPAPNFAFELCAQRAGRIANSIDLSHWRAAICGGEPIREQSLNKFAEAFGPFGFRRRAFVPAYGLAESTLIATAPTHGVDFVAKQRLVSCGHTWEGQEVVVVDPVRLERVEQGQTGEIWLKGRSVAAGYWNRPEETAETFHAQLGDAPNAGTWLRTGDLGYLCDEGLIATGRRKDLIIVRGTNFDPADIEAAAKESSEALSTGVGAAFPVEDDAVEAVVLVHEVGRDALKNLDANAVTARVVQAVSHEFGLTLHDLVLVRPGTLPRTTSGKIQRYACKERYLAGTLSALAVLKNPALGRFRPDKEDRS